MKSSRLSAALWIPAALVATAVPAAAHPGHGPANSFSAGFAHPFSGLDHLLAACAVGLWAVRLGRRALLPLTFLSCLALGAVAGHAIGPVRGIDAAIALSLTALGVLVALDARPRAIWAAAIAGGFALLHGLAHGAEMPATAGGLAFGIGFLLATAILMSAGIAVAAFAQTRRSQAVRFLGWGVAAAGVIIILT